jgi:hypothetical protein
MSRMATTEMSSRTSFPLTTCSVLRAGNADTMAAAPAAVCTATVTV